MGRWSWKPLTVKLKELRVERWGNWLVVWIVLWTGQS